MGERTYLRENARFVYAVKGVYKEKQQEIRDGLEVAFEELKKECYCSYVYHGWKQEHLVFYPEYPALYFGTLKTSVPISELYDDFYITLDIKGISALDSGFSLDYEISFQTSTFMCRSIEELAEEIFMHPFDYLSDEVTKGAYSPDDDEVVKAKKAKEFARAFDKEELVDKLHNSFNDLIDKVESIFAGMSTKLEEVVTYKEV